MNGDGRGQWLEAEFEHPTRIRGIRVAAGWLSQTRGGLDLFTANARIRTLRVTADGRELGRWNTQDGQREIVVAGIDVRATRFRFELVEMWPGQRFQDATISEVAFVGTPEENRAAWSTWTMHGHEGYRGEERCHREAWLRHLSENPRSNLTVLNADINLDCTHESTAGEE